MHDKKKVLAGPFRLIYFHILTADSALSMISPNQRVYDTLND